MRALPHRPNARVLLIAASLIAGAVAVPAATGGVSASGTRRTVLVLGDSVLSVLRWAPESNQPLWSAGYDVVNEAWGCQSLLGPGCPGSGGRSALQRLQDHRADEIDIVVVGTGYNDVGDQTLRDGMKKISAEARRQGIPVMWLTYHERSVSTRRSRSHNAVVRATAPRLDNVTVVDWNKHARRHSSWFSHKGVHMNRFGGKKLGAFLAARLDEHFAGAGN